MALFIIADDSHRFGKMRGRGTYTDVPPRRNPVRIEDVEHIYTGSRKAARISDYANEDSEDLSRRSHLKDRKLLDDITTKLASTSYTEPVYVRPRARSATRRAPVVVGRKPVPSTATAARAATLPRRVGIRPVPTLPRRYHRASSVPPRYVEEEVVTPYNFYEVATPRSYYYTTYRPPPAKYVPAPAPRPFSRASSEPPMTRSSTRSSTLAVKNARRCLDRIERELGVDDLDYPPPPAPIAREHVVRARTSVRGASRPAGAGAGAAGAVRRRPGSLPPPSSRGRVSQAEIESEVEEYLTRPAIQPSLRSRASSLERIRAASPVVVRAPPAIAPIRSTAAILRRASLSGPVERMPDLDPYRPKQGSSSSYTPLNGPTVGGYGTSIAPYTPARISKAGGGASAGGLPPKAPAFRPEMSDTRKRIRDVICMTRRDPYYYS